MGVLRWRKESRDSSNNNNNTTNHGASTPPIIHEEIKDDSIIMRSTKELLEEALLLETTSVPMIMLPPIGGYWTEDPAPLPSSVSRTIQLEVDDTATVYRTHFANKEHCNLLAEDPNIGPVLMSIRTDTFKNDGGQNQEITRVLLRLKSGTKHLTITEQTTSKNPLQLARLASAEIASCDDIKFTPVTCPRVSDLITQYDEHALCKNFKFGVLQQRRGQTTEEEIFSNREPSEALLDFLPHLGDRVKLAQHKGYRGGLDTQFGQTGEESVYTIYKGREIMYHVAPMLPHSDTDNQQLQRKRHIGNDIVAIVFQDENTPFAPDMIASHFLHVFIVIKPLPRVLGSNDIRYRVSVAARDDVPKFGPALPPNSEFSAGPHFREWLITKLINAETAACKAEKFASLEGRTRGLLLTSLVDDLQTRTKKFLGLADISLNNTPNKHDSSVSSGRSFISTVRRAIRVRSQSQPTGPTNTAPPPPVRVKRKSAPAASPSLKLDLRHPNVSGNSSMWNTSGNSSWNNSGIIETPTSSPDLEPRTPNGVARLATSESDASSVGSAGSDTGLDSITSSENKQEQNNRPVSCNSCIQDGRLDILSQEVARLKCDKLDLLRNNVVCQREVKALREQMMQLQSDFALASKELFRMRVVLRECAEQSEAV